MPQSQRSNREIDGLVSLLLTACDDAGMRETLEKLLSLPDNTRRDFLALTLDQLRKSRAPAQLTQALSCVLDDQIAERACEVIFNGKRSAE